jgi:hypothetical protein
MLTNMLIGVVAAAVFGSGEHWVSGRARPRDGSRVVVGRRGRDPVFAVTHIPSADRSKITQHHIGLMVIGIMSTAVMLSRPVLVAQQVVDRSTTTIAVYIPAPRTNADPRAKLVQDLRKYFRDHPKQGVRVVDDAKAAKFVIDVKRPDITGSVIPYIESGAGDDRITAAAVYVAGAHVCGSTTDHCTDFTASAKLRTMAMLQLAEKIAKHVTTSDP